eukprot:8681077-Heterocapsa_arctica.AAC.1
MTGPAKARRRCLAKVGRARGGSTRPGRARPMRSHRDRLAGNDPWWHGVRARVGSCGDSVGWGDA